MSSQLTIMNAVDSDAAVSARVRATLQRAYSSMVLISAREGGAYIYHSKLVQVCPQYANIAVQHIDVRNHDVISAASFVEWAISGQVTTVFANYQKNSPAIGKALLDMMLFGDEIDSDTFVQYLIDKFDNVVKAPLNSDLPFLEETLKKAKPNSRLEKFIVRGFTNPPEKRAKAFKFEHADLITKAPTIATKVMGNLHAFRVMKRKEKQKPHAKGKQKAIQGRRTRNNNMHDDEMDGMDVDGDGDSDGLEDF
ncbi:hypothetical protein BDZ85DRAFT_307806 [Elsinoe ampelina]|uniref:Uncharacterized protein n=1 Tax=Elsinoe ampelina TaxID=302913 RepID=A0A6A6GJC6_9PEZI|nr:hypothetical protein BDZ85DRAFT_307806 [Elsinoe ampelina]